MRTFAPSVLAVALALGPAVALADAAPKYYLVVQPLEGAKDIPPQLVDKLFREEVAKHPELTTERPDMPKEPKAIADKLAELKLKGYYVTVKILNSKRTLTPASAGKRPQLEREVKLSLIGATIPEQLVAFGGDGESIAAAEVGKTISPQEESSLLSDALKDAITQAVTTAVNKLEAAGKGSSGHAKRKKPAAAPAPGAAPAK
jgi:hypothetical protein